MGKRWGPPGTIYDATETGWFDSRTIRQWFKECFIPFVEPISRTKLLISDNLASHFTPEVILLAEKKIYILQVCH